MGESDRGEMKPLDDSHLGTSCQRELRDTLGSSPCPSDSLSCTRSCRIVTVRRQQPPTSAAKLFS